MLQDARTWTTLVYFVIMLPLGILYFITAVTGLSVGLSFFIIPLVSDSQRLDWWVLGADTG